MYFLEDETIGMRTLTEDDVEGNYSSWFNDVLVCKYNSHHRFPMYKSDLLNYVNGLPKDRSQIVFAVEAKESQKHIGNISLQNIDLLNRQAEIAFIFGEKEFWGKGYATKAATMIIEHAFSELNMNRLYFGTADNNIGMQKVGEKLNFKRVGIMRQAIYKHGEYHDIYEYDLLRKEWNIEK